MVILTASFALFSAGNALRGATPPQSKRSRNEKDFNAIGKRRIDQGTNLFSPEKERQLGKQLVQHVERDSRFIDDPTVIEFIQRLTQNLARNSDARIPITVRVIDSDKIDAFTLPDGNLFLTTGLILQTEREAELAGVLARGIAHTALRSHTRILTRSMNAQMNRIPKLMDPATRSPEDPSGNLSLSDSRDLLEWQQDSEFDADYFGLQYLYKAGYDTGPFIQFVERIGPGASPGKSAPNSASRYPPVAKRVKALTNEAAEILPQREGAFVSSPEFDAFKERVRTLTVRAPKQ